MTARARHRQLRLLHLQPRPVARGARGRARGRAQRPRARVDELLAAAPDRVVVSPGPCTPDDAGISLEVVRALPGGRHPDARRLPRAPVARAGLRRHGGAPRCPCTARRPTIEHDGRGALRGPARASPSSALPLADRRRGDAARLLRGRPRRGGGVIHGHPPPELPAEGVQFHPESVLTPDGSTMLANFLARAAGMTRVTARGRREIRAVHQRRRSPTGDRRTPPLGRDLSREARPAAAARSRSWPATPRRSRPPPSWSRCAARARPVEELAGLARTMRALASPCRRAARRPRRHRRHRRRRDRPSTSRRPRRSSPPARAARSPSTATARRRACAARADVLEALGARIDLDPRPSRACIDEIGFGFMFAPAHHPAMRFVVPVAPACAVRTIFNFLGPLTNPAGAQRQVIGVGDPAYARLMAGALATLGVERALVAVAPTTASTSSRIGRDPKASRSRRRRTCGASRSTPRTPASSAAPRRRPSTAGPRPRTPSLPLGARRRHRAGTRHRRAERRRRASSSPASPMTSPRVACSPPTAIDYGSAARSARRRWWPPRRRRVAAMNSAGPASSIAPATTSHAARRRSRSRSSRRSSRRAATSRAASTRRCCGPGVAVIAEHKRRSPSAGAIREGVDASRRSCRPTSAAARRRLSVLTEGPHFGGSLDDLRTPARPSSCRSCARTSSSTPTRCRVGGGRRRRDPADRRGARRRASSPSCTREARELDLDVLVEVHDEDELDAALEVDRRRHHRHQQPRPHRLHRRPRAHLRAAHRRPRRARPSSRSRASTPASSSRSSSASGVDAVLIGEALMRADDPRRRCARCAGTDES